MLRGKQKLRERTWIIKSTILAGIVLFAIAALISWLRPATIVNRAFQRLSQADEQQFVATIQVENDQTTKTILGEEATIELVLDGLFQRQDDQRDSLQADVTLAAQTESLRMLVEGELRFIDDEAYLLIQKTPPAFPPLVALKDQWAHFPRGGEKQSISALTADDHLFTAVERIGTKEINGTTTRTYRISATPEAILRMLDSIADILGTRLTEQQITNFRQGVASVESLPVTVAVTPWSRHLRQLSTQLNLPGGNTVNFEITLQDPETSTNIAPPADSKPIQALLGTTKE